ncbi:CPBP family intramembrane glutamic endopeptidase [Myxosarcina sp. GI1]|uniref:CPBP family intramembrane glutamic endopeptidase n=1 Tax=Myxosarcina sp. GI1 TaxID=1541065 RepID=UPI0006904722|nr:type II CAAX endopeptidase family protein [Myxosarcina sp. GI1]
MFATSLSKVAFFFIAWAIIWLPIGVLVSRKIQCLPNRSLTTNQKLILLATLYPIAPLILWWQTRFEGLSFLDFGLDWQLSLAASFSWGLMISLAELAIVFGVEFKLDLIKWHWQNWQFLRALFLPIFGLSLAISFVEELVFRGYVIRELTIDLPYWLAATIASIIFALLHLVWERKQTIPQLPGLWLMGMVLTVAKIVDGGSIGLAWGLHTGWICGLTCIDSAQLLTYKQEIVWITGVDRQPLAGIAGIMCLLATPVILWIPNAITDAVMQLLN